MEIQTPEVPASAERAFRQCRLSDRSLWNVKTDCSATCKLSNHMCPTALGKKRTQCHDAKNKTGVLPCRANSSTARNNLWETPAKSRLRWDVNDCDSDSMPSALLTGWSGVKGLVISNLLTEDHDAENPVWVDQSRRDQVSSVPLEFARLC